MDGDHSVKTMDSGANSAINNAEFGDAVHESSHQARAAGEKTTGHGGSVFDKTGAIGKQFTTEGAIGGTVQKVGGPFDANNGSIGKQFTAEGSIGAMAQNLADKNQQH